MSLPIFVFYEKGRLGVVYQCPSVSCYESVFEFQDFSFIFTVHDCPAFYGIVGVAGSFQVPLLFHARSPEKLEGVVFRGFYGKVGTGERTGILQVFEFYVVGEDFQVFAGSLHLIFRRRVFPVDGHESLGICEFAVRGILHTY